MALLMAAMTYTAAQPVRSLTSVLVPVLVPTITLILALSLASYSTLSFLSSLLNPYRTFPRQIQVRW